MIKNYNLSRRQFLQITGLAASSRLFMTSNTPYQEAQQVQPAFPNIISRVEWGASDLNHNAREEFGLATPYNIEGWRDYYGELRNAYQTVVIHHSSLYDTNDDRTVRTIQNLHLTDRQWADIGYHYCVGLSGRIYEGRRLSVRGTHTELANTGSLGICLLGNFDDLTPTEAQITGTLQLLQWLSPRLQLTHLAGHLEFNEITVCPGRNLFPLLDGLAETVQLERGTEGYVLPPRSDNCCG